MVLICGVDEAGRGPVIGPMVMCGIVIDKAKEKQLSAIGVKDSKLLSFTMREELYDEIKRLVADFRICIVSPEEIDEAVFSRTNNLNLLEASKTAHIISMLKPDIAYLDCPTTNIESYVDYIIDQTKSTKTKIIAEHKADVNHPVVAAASILAKVMRDREIQKLKRKHRVEFGSGYPSDPYTRQFLASNYKKYPFFRKSWSSWKNAAGRKSQMSLSRY